MRIHRQDGMGIVSLFSGIASIDRGLLRHMSEEQILLFCEVNPDARKVLQAAHPGVPIHEDVRTLKRLPGGSTIVTAGAPCTDLSSLGECQGIHGPSSSLIDHVFRLVESHEGVHTVVLENVPNILSLHGGQGMHHVSRRLVLLGFEFAYRVLDLLSFGLPQRRRRFLLVARRTGSEAEGVPWWMLLDRPYSCSATGGRAPTFEQVERDGFAGFYITEGKRGSGFRSGVFPTLKCNGNGLRLTNGFNPHAVMLPHPRKKDGRRILKMHPDDAEVAQGIEAGLTEPAGSFPRRFARLGNTCPVPFAEWVGLGLSGKVSGETESSPPPPIREADLESMQGSAWPLCAAVDRTGRVLEYARSEAASEAFLRHMDAPRRPGLLRAEESLLVSLRSLKGYLRRAEAGRPAMPEWALELLRDEVRRIEAGELPAAAVQRTDRARGCR